MKKQKILYIHQYFKHPSEPGGTRSYWIAQELIRQGYEVTMLSHKNILLSHVKDAKQVERMIIDGIKIIYIRNAYSNDMSLTRRVLSFLSFSLRAIKYALKEKDVDMVIATSTPLTVAIPTLLRFYLKRTPYVFEVRDLWPEGPIQMGLIKNPVLIKFLRWFEKLIYKKAAHVITLSPGMQEGVVKYIPSSRTSMIPNMAKIDKFRKREKNKIFERDLKLRNNSFKVIYFGQMGESNAIPYIIKTIELINKKTETIEFIFAGHGKFFNYVEETIINHGWDNVKLFERMPMDAISELLNLCDLSLITFCDLPILKTNSPNKLFDSISAGVPVIVNSDGWTKEMVEKNHCGAYVDPQKPEELAEKILFLQQSPKLLAEMGNNARQLAEREYDKSILCPRFVDIVKQMIG